MREEQTEMKQKTVSKTGKAKAAASADGRVSKTRRWMSRQEHAQQCKQQDREAGTAMRQTGKAADKKRGKGNEGEAKEKALVKDTVSKQGGKHEKGKQSKPFVTGSELNIPSDFTQGHSDENNREGRDQTQPDENTGTGTAHPSKSGGEARKSEVEVHEHASGERKAQGTLRELEREPAGHADTEHDLADAGESSAPEAQQRGAQQRDQGGEEARDETEEEERAAFLGVSWSSDLLDGRLPAVCFPNKAFACPFDALSASVSCISFALVWPCLIRWKDSRRFSAGVPVSSTHMLLKI